VNDPQQESSDSTAKAKPLSAGDAAELAARVAELANAGLPLAPGLRAAAADLPNSRLAAALARVAAALERGESLEQAITAERGSLPSHLQALIAAGVRSGKLGLVLEEFVRFRQIAEEARRSVWRALAYPILLLMLIVAIISFYFAYVFPSLARLQGILRSEPETGVEASRWVEEHSDGLLIAAIVVVSLLAFLAFNSRRLTRRMLNRAPLFGALWRFAGMAEWAELLRILLSNEVPMPEALRLSAAGIRDADLSSAVGLVAARVESGMRLADAVEGLPAFGATIKPILAWGEAHSRHPEALDVIASMAIQRLELRADLIKAIVPPAVFIVVTGIILVTVRLPARAIMAANLTWFYSSSSSSAELRLPSPSFSGAASLLLIGTVVLIALGIVYRGRKPPADQPQILMRLAGWLLLAIGILGMLLVVFDEMGLILWLIGIGCWGGAVYRFRRSQQLTQLKLLAISADRGMPLEPAVRALAEEEGGPYFWRATKLADSLAAGTPLALAIEANHKTLPPLTFMAARIGEVTGALGATLRSVDTRRNRPSGILHEPSTRLSSFFYIITVLGVAVPYTALKIVPKSEKIYLDFHRQLPPFTAAMFQVLSSSLTITLCVLSLAAAVFVAIYGMLRELGWIRFDLPPFGRLTAPLDAAVVLRLLSLVAQRGRPTEQALDFLAHYYPRQLMRRRLRRASADIGRGRDWSGSLRAAKLVQKTDEAILRAAARVGNVPWALNEAAANGERRMNFRLSAIGQIVFPLLILLVGAAVMAFVVGWFLPLIELINGLAQPKW
jgi:type II secretory pathway component PulF